MSKLKIVFLDAQTLGNDVSLESVISLGDYVAYPSTSPEETIGRIAGADVVITNKVYMGKEQIDSCPTLKLICVAATGTNNVDMDYAAQKGIPVRNAIDYSTESVAQVTFMQVLNLVGKSSFFDNYVKSGEYGASGCFTNAAVPFFELKGKRYGVVGLGNIGSRVASIASAFGMEVVYFPTSGKPHSSEYRAITDLKEFLSSCDVVSVHCPLNDRTKGLIGYQQLGWMKSSAFIVNMGRGGIIDEADLARALNDGTIAGAAVDVFTKEPFAADHPYMNLKNPGKLLLTPHIGWASREARECLIGKITENIKK
ncbi:MAG: D-2-hydroxyacid dehydrogenase [Bacteroidales bacterium]|nr:D-2-hydroxyacid dehydrogenase [Candidatus Cacconaster caballi]